jgi:stage V sporulation protein G|nr:SpoVG family protein [uncultured Lachnoclostridium sp.]
MKQNKKWTLDVGVNPVENGGNIKAYASVNIDGAFAIKNLRIIESSKGLFVAMPSVKKHKGGYDEIFFPITKESRVALNDAVIAAYELKLNMADNHTQEKKDTPELSM